MRWGFAAYRLMLDPVVCARTRVKYVISDSRIEKLFIGMHTLCRVALEAVIVLKDVGDAIEVFCSPS